jgi:heat shock protein HtpX
MVNLHDRVRKNKRLSIVILFLFTLFSMILFAIASFIIAWGTVGQSGDFTHFYFICAGSLFILFLYILWFFNSGDKMILKSTGAQEVSRKHHAFLFHSVEALSLAAGMSTPPKCYVIKDTALNAYATGFKPENSYVVVTTGLLEKLNRQEIEGVLAHEISHIKNQDIKVMLYISGLLGVFTLLGTLFFHMVIGVRTGGKNGGSMKLVFLGLWILFSVIGVFFATLFKFALSRRREYLADSNGALLTRYPEGLASALEKIRSDPDPLVDKANRATAHLFISNPFRDKNSAFAGLFSTHPPIDERIARLRGKRT